MNCNEYMALQSQFIDKELNETTAQEVRAHLETCPHCMTRHKEMERLIHALHKTADVLADIPVPQELEAEILTAVRKRPEKRENPVWVSRIFSSWQLYSVAAACLLVCTVHYGLSGAHLSHSQQLGHTVAPPSRVEASLPNAPASLPSSPVESPSASPSPAAKPSAANQYEAPPAPRTATATESVPSPATPTPKPFSFFVKQGTGESPLRGKTKTTESASQTTPASKTPASSPKTYATVSSLVKRGIVFVVDDLNAASVFQSASPGGEHAVRQALTQAGYDFSIREIILEEYADQYNALVREANTLSGKIAKGETNLSASLSQKEKEMQALKDACSTPSLQLAYQ